MKPRASGPRRPLRRPDIRLVEHQTGPHSMLDVIYLLQPMSPRGKAWLEGHAAGRQWLDGALVMEPGIYAEGSLLAMASAAGLGITGWGPVSGAMLYELRVHGPELTLKQLAGQLGFTAKEWQLMENDERMIPNPDAFWDRAMALQDELQDKRERRAGAAEFN